MAWIHPRLTSKRLTSKPLISGKGSRIPCGWGPVALVWVSLFWFAFVAVPVAMILARVTGFQVDGSSLLEPTLLSVVRITLIQAASSTAISVLIGFPLGLWVGKHAADGSRSAKLSQAFLAVPYSVPTVVVGSAAILWMGRSGLLANWGLPLDWAYTLRGVILAHVFLNAPWIALLVAQSRSQFPTEQLEAARTLGAGFAARLRLLIWPFVRSSTAYAGIQVFSLCAMSFGLVLLLGGGPPVQTLETAIYAQMRFGSPDLGSAAACAVWQLGITLVPWVLVSISFSDRREGLFSIAPRTTASKRFASFADRGRAIALPMVCALPLLPYLPLVFGVRWAALADSGISLSLGNSLRVSIEIAVGSAVLSTLTALAGVLAGFRYRALAASLRILLSLPSGISMLVLGIGGWLAYGRWIDPFEGSLFAIIALQATAFFPLVLRMLWPVAERVQTVQLEAAWTLGASPWAAYWRIEGPRWRSPLTSAFAITAGASLGELGAVSLFYSEKLMSLPLWVVRLMGQYRFEEAQAVSVVLLLLSAGMVIGTLVFGKASR